MSGTCALAAGTRHGRPQTHECPNQAVGIARDRSGLRLAVCAEHADHISACWTCRGEGIEIESRTDGAA